MKKIDRRYSWQFAEDLLTVLIQYVGDETIKTTNYHGNCKTENPQPMNSILPSVRETIVNSPRTPARLYEEMRLNAGSSAYEQSKLVPKNKSQIKNLQRMERKKKRNAMGDEVGLAPCTLHLAPCTPGRRLLVPPAPSKRDGQLPTVMLQACYHGG